MLDGPLALALSLATACFCLIACGSAATPSSPGQRVFDANGCGSCHTLAAAGARGTVGTDLDKVRLTPAAVSKVVRHGRGQMPAFPQISEADLRTLADYVSTRSRAR